MNTKLTIRTRVPRPQVVLATAAWLSALGFFLALSVLAADHHLLVGDLGLARSIQAVDAAPLRTALSVAEFLADMPLLLGAYVLTASTLWLTRRRWEVGLLALTALGRSLIFLVKDLVERPRPSPELVAVAEEASGFAFPSGHVVGAVLFYGFLFYLALVTIPQRRWRWLVQGACISIVGLVALQRVYAGVHWPSDVLGGLLLGTLLLTLVVSLHRRTLSTS